MEQRLGETLHYSYDGIHLTSIVGDAAHTFSYDATHARLTRVQGAVPGSTPLDLFVTFDGLGRLVSQSGTLGPESVSRSYSYDGLSRLQTAVGPWEKPSGESGNVTWSYSYDALGNLRGQTSSRSDQRTWSYVHATKPRFLTSFAQAGQPTETLLASVGGEVAVLLRPGSSAASLAWNAQGKLHHYKDSTYSYDVYDQATLVVTGPGGAASIVRVGEDFEYDIGAQRANKFFSLDGVRIASLATSYEADSASLPPALRIVLRHAEPLAAPAATALLTLGLLGLASLMLRRRTPVWLSAPGVGVLAFTLIALPYTAHAATLTSGPGAYGRHGEPILAYLVDHLGTIRGAVNQAGTVIETRDYAPFGESIAKTGTFAVQHRFTGQPQDDQAGGLYNYGARFYNAKWGRFVSPDEVVQGFDSQGLNPFAYVLNRPTSARDSTGNFLVIPPVLIPPPTPSPASPGITADVMVRIEFEAGSDSGDDPNSLWGRQRKSEEHEGDLGESLRADAVPYPTDGYSNRPSMDQLDDLQDNRRRALQKRLGDLRFEESLLETITSIPGIPNPPTGGGKTIPKTLPQVLGEWLIRQAAMARRRAVRAEINAVESELKGY